MFPIFILLLALLGMAVSGPVARRDASNADMVNTDPQGVVLCPEATGGPDCIFQPLRPGACLLLPCKAGSCTSSMDNTWKTFFLNPGTVCTLHVADNCDPQGIMRADSIFYPGTPDLAAWGRDRDRGFRGSEVTYLAYRCFSTGS